MTIFDVNHDALTGGATDLDRDRGSVPPVVTVASRRGTTPQFVAAPDDPATARLSPRAAPDGPEPDPTAETLLPR